MWQVECEHKGCGFVARGRLAQEVSAWLWHHLVIAHRDMPDLGTIDGKVRQVRGQIEEVGFPGTPSAERFIPPARRAELGKAPLEPVAAGCGHG